MKSATRWFWALFLAIGLAGIAAPAPRSRAAGQDLPPAGQAIAAAPGQVRLVSSTLAGVTFEVSVPWQSLALTPLTAGGKDYVRVSLPGWQQTGRPGAPALPLLTEAIGVPFGTVLSVQVEPGAAHRVILPAAVLPAARQEIESQPPPAEDALPSLPAPITVVEEDPAVYSRSGAPYPGPLAVVTGDGVMRQQRIAGIAAYPVQYDPAGRALTVYERLRITVSFEPSGAGDPPQLAGPPIPESEAYEQVFRGALLNYSAARAWRMAVPPSPSGTAMEGSAIEDLRWTPPSPGWRVKVRTTGLYELTYSSLSAAGLPVQSIDPTTFKLYYLGGEVAIQEKGNGNTSFEAGESIVFFGEAVTSKYAADNVYWLTYGGVTGRRMSSRVPIEPGQPAQAFVAHPHLETNSVYLSTTPGDDNLDRWFWNYLYTGSASTSKTYTLSLSSYRPREVPDTLRVSMLGKLDKPVNPDHHVAATLNGTPLGAVWWDGITWKLWEVPIPAGVLITGTNTLVLTGYNDTGAGTVVVYVDWLELDHGSNYVAASGSLAFHYEEPGTHKYTVSGYTNGSLAVYDVTDPGDVVRIEDIQPDTSSPYSAVFTDTISAPTDYRAIDSTALKPAYAIEPDTSSLPSPPNGADHIIISHPTFAAQAAQLQSFRASQGLDAVAVNLQDVYDEFGYGIAGAAAIHDFLAYAYANWQAPSYVVLIGDGHYDPKNNAYPRVSYLPPYLANVDSYLWETAADNRYVTLVGNDILPDMMLGRLSVNTTAEAAGIVNKIIAYEASPTPGDWRRQVLAVADDQDEGGDFDGLSDLLLDCCLPQPYQASKVHYKVTHPTLAGAKAAILAGINAGKLIVNYIGHATAVRWGLEDLLLWSDLSGLTNGAKTPVMLPMTCSDGYYIYPFPQSNNLDSLGELVTRIAGKGAVASWSPTGYGMAIGHDYLDRGFFTSIFLDAAGGLGQATIAGKLTLYASGTYLDLIDTYLLFGDPATRLVILPPAAIGNRVWLDENGNGTQEAGEAGIANARVWLKNRSGNVVATTWTDTNGGYLFADLAVALGGTTYYVDVDESTLPGTMIQTPYANQGADLGNQDQTVEGRGYKVTAMPGVDNLSADFGFNYSLGENGALGDRVWSDTNGDGHQDSGEPGIAGVTLELSYDPDGDGVIGNVYGTATTGLDGRYLFGDLPAGIYRVRVTDTAGVLSGYTQTGDPDHYGSGGPDNDGQTTSPVVQSPGDLFANVDLGYLPPAGTTGAISGTLWFDADADGLADSGEYGIAGVSVALVQDLDGDGAWDAGEPVIATAVTGGDGLYRFAGLPAADGIGTDDYIVWVNDTANVLGEMHPRYDAAGPADGVSSVPDLSPAGDASQLFSYSPDEVRLGTGLIGGTIWLNQDGDSVQDPGEPGLEGVIVERYDSTGTTLQATTVTDENGHYSFPNLPDATYVIRVAAANLAAGGALQGMTNTADPNGGNDGQSVSVISGHNVDLGLSLGYSVPAGWGSIGNLIWNDLNAGGDVDPGENGLEGVTVDLYRDLNGNGLLDAGEPRMDTTVADAAGAYSFTGLPVADNGYGAPGADYIVDVTDTAGRLAGYWQSWGVPGSDGNSQVDGYPVSIGELNPDAAGVDLGYYVLPAALGNWVWKDSDGDGIQDPGEPGLPDVQVVLTITWASSVTTVIRTATDANGFYRFDNLLLDEDHTGLGAGDPLFTLGSSSPPGYTASPSDQGSDDTVDSDNPNGVSAVATKGATNDSYDFGLLEYTTGIELLWFRARGEQTSIVARWETVSELDNIGFNLHRARSLYGLKTQINDTLIESLVPPGSPYGAVYEYPDTTARRGIVYFYWLESVSSGGESSWYGPVRAILPGRPTDPGTVP